MTSVSGSSDAALSRAWTNASVEYLMDAWTVGILNDIARSFSCFKDLIRVADKRPLPLPGIPETRITAI
jgi:hypothetical protein